jgi:hypothetical protein
MKKLTTLLLVIFSVIVGMAQAPQAINYQAVARMANGQIMANSPVTARFSIIEGSALGATIYQENHSTTTNNFGLFTLSIGKGNATAGTFSSIPWGTGNKFLKVEIAPQGGTIYLLQGTTQLLSVPYALYAENTKLLAGNNTVTVNGNTIMGNYQASNNTIVVTGNTIAGNYLPAADSTIRINGNVIGGNYKPSADSTIRVNGNTIAGNYKAGTGINIAGNVISATAGANSWVTDANGIHNQSGNVGIGGNSTANVALDITQQPTGGVSAGLVIKSTDQWHTAMGMLNTTTSPNNRYSFSLGGSSNVEIGPGNWGIMNHNNSKWAFKINGTNNNIGIGLNNVANSETPKSRLHVYGGDVNIDQIGSGIIMKSPNGQCWRVTVDNTGALVSTAITCP